MFLLFTHQFISTFFLYVFFCFHFLCTHATRYFLFYFFSVQPFSIKNFSICDVVMVVIVQVRLALSLRMWVAQVMCAKMMEIRTVRWIWNTMRIKHAAGITTRTKSTAWRWWRHGGTVHIKAGILFLPFSSSVLEPNFHLRQTLSFGLRWKCEWYCLPVFR